MTRAAAMKSLPDAVLAEMAVKVREEKWGPTALSNWLIAAGYQVGLQPIGRWYREQKARIEAAETLVTATYKAVVDNQSVDVTVEVDLLAMLEATIYPAVQGMTSGVFAEMPPDRLVNAVCKIEAAKLARSKFAWEKGATEALQLKRAGGSPDIDEATLVQVRQRIYGIFTDDASD